MNWVDRKRHPKECEGDLGKKRHVLGGVRVDDGECDDHMCDGHSSFFVLCSCGYCVRVSGSVGYEDYGYAEHRMKVIEHHLGLEFRENDDE